MMELRVGAKPAIIMALAGNKTIVRNKEIELCRREMAPMRKKLEELEATIEKFSGLVAKVDGVLANPEAFAKNPAQAKLLIQQRADLAKALARTEEEWFALSSKYEAAMAG